MRTATAAWTGYEDNAVDGSGCSQHDPLACDDGALDDRRRRLDWRGFLNARDLGGHPTKNGSRTRWGFVVRADMPRPMAMAACAAVCSYCIRSVLDLRLPEQASRNPSPFAAMDDSEVVYHRLPFAGPVDSMRPDFGSLELQYELMVGAFARVAPNVMAAIASAEGGVLVHCEYGKDRTGLVCALLLDIAGVPRQIVAEDYTATADSLQPVFDRFLASGPGDRRAREADLARFMPRPEVILTTLANLDAHYGGVEGYLSWAGVPRAVRDRLGCRLVDYDSLRK